MTWKEYLKNTRSKYELIITAILLVVVLSGLTRFLNHVEARKGIVLPDPVLPLFAPVNLTWLIFGLIYFSLFFTIYMLFNKPERLMLTVQTYILVILVRIAAMFAAPFNPPAGMIRLDDPFVQFFGTGQLLTKDLFFSGHTATLFLLFLVVENKKVKLLLLVFTIVVAGAVLLQHIHYTIDVLAAPFFTYGCYAVIKLARKKFGFELDK